MARITLTYRELSETVDEVAHVGAGMEWLALGTYTFELQHPPLARIAAAAGPYLLGIRAQHQSTMWDEGRRVLYAGGRYLRNLTAARLGMLPFFGLAALFIWRIGRAAFGTAEALGAVACFTLLPPILAHFGLATTDGPMFAMFAAATYALVRWLAAPNVVRGIALGVATALAVVSKFSAIPYLGATAALLIAARAWSARRTSAGHAASGPGAAMEVTARWPWRQSLLSAIAGGVAGFVVAWAVYRFSIGSVLGIPMPLAEIPKGIREVVEHSRVGHPAYFLGTVRVFGVWYFFPVMLVLKTPLSALALGALGFVLLTREAWRGRRWMAFAPVAVAVAVIAVAMPSAITIGVRHVLPFYLGLSLAVGVAWPWLWERLTTHRRRAALAAITTLLSVGSLTVHPDYLAYFNVLAGPDPARLVADSDLDWGQDLFRLRRAAATRNVDTLTFAYIGTADLSPIVGVPVRFWNGEGRPHGWVAVAETWYRRGQVYERRGKYVVEPRALWWLDSAATATRIGYGIRLYHVPAPPLVPAR